jgi:very-short-patch-repair endonuclease
LEEYEKKLKQPSRELRKSLTEAEKLLWSKIRLKQLSNILFYRQKPLGGYIVDFYCPKAKLVIEVDGEHHFSKEAREYDKVRDEFLKTMKLKVLRFTNSDVLNNIEAVIEKIENNLGI